MSKYYLTIIIFTLFQTSFSQTDEKRIWRNKRDSLKKILPILKDSARVDCLNMLAYTYSHKYYDWDWDPKQLLDSCGPLATEANELAKKIGYKKGLGYSYLRMADLEKFKNDTLSIRYDKFENEHFNKQALNTQEKFLQLAISVGEQIKDHIILGKAYMELCILTCLKVEFKQLEKYLSSSLYYLKTSGKQQKGEYKEYDYADCAGCNGNEYWLGELYRSIAKCYREVGNVALAEEYMAKGVEYFNKTIDKERLGLANWELSYVAMRNFNYDRAIEASKNGILAYHQAGNIEFEISCYNELSKMYEILGDFENGVEYCKKSTLIAEKLAREEPKKSKGNISGIAFFWMCRLYKIAGDYETALEIIRQARNYFSDNLYGSKLWTSEIGDVHRLMKNYDSSFYYLKSFDTIKNNPSNFGKANLGYLHLDLKEYDKALELGKSLVQYQKSIKRITVPLAWGLLISGNAYMGKKDFLAGLRSAREALGYLKLMNGKVLMIDNYKLLFEIFRNMGKYDSAYYYLHQYTALKDSLLTRQFLWKLNSYKKQAEEERKTSQINLLNKDNQLKEQKLKQQATLRNSLIAGLLLLFLLGVFIFRNLLLKRKNDKLRMQKDFELQKLESEKKQAELHQRAIELEMQALRAQMNPHFIFNCLSSINRFIFKNDNKTASDYLTRFSRLIRMVLLHSQKKMIPLEDELEMIRLYLDLERLRFKDAFDYSITTTNIVDAGNIFVPPLLLQPFCENAVWHGLMHKESKGHLNVIISEVVSENDKTLHCVIEDDGVGREKAAAMKSKSAGNEKSLGLKITTERLALLNQENNFSTFYKIDDILNEENNVAGTRVQLKIRYKESVEEVL